MITTTYYPKAQSILYSLLGFLFLGSNTQVNGHGVEVRHCLTTSPANNLRIFVEHSHGDLTFSTQPGTMVIKNNMIGITSTLTPSGIVNNIDVDNGGSLPGCPVGVTPTVATTCLGQVKNDWVYYDFPFSCDTDISYTLHQGKTIYLTQGCNNLYPATISPYENCVNVTSDSPPQRKPSSTSSSESKKSNKYRKKLLRAELH